MGITWRSNSPSIGHMTVIIKRMYLQMTVHTRSFTNMMSDMNNWMGEYTNVM